MALLLAAVRVKIFLSFFGDVGCRFTQINLLSIIANHFDREAGKVYDANHAPY